MASLLVALGLAVSLRPAAGLTGDATAALACDAIQDEDQSIPALIQLQTKGLHATDKDASRAAAANGTSESTVEVYVPPANLECYSGVQDAWCCEHMGQGCEPGSETFHDTWTNYTSLPPDAVDNGQRFIWLAHHRTGSGLSVKLSNILAKSIGAGPRDVVAWGYGGPDGVALPRRYFDMKMMWDMLRWDIYSRYAFTEAWQDDIGVGCQKSQVTAYSNIVEEQLAKVTRQCPNIKAVHFSRDPIELLLSSYVYHKTPEGSHDCLPNSCYNAHIDYSIANGLNTEAQAQAMYVLDDMISILNTTLCDDRMISLTVDDFKTDPAGTSRRLLQHMLGGSEHEGKVEELVAQFAAELPDMSETSAEEDKARAVMETMKDDPAIAAIYEYKRKFDMLRAGGCQKAA